jgi:5-carboxymethyl-2-hydroxymuconate isomerase
MSTNVDASADMEDFCQKIRRRVLKFDGMSSDFPAGSLRSRTRRRHRSCQTQIDGEENW